MTTGTFEAEVPEFVQDMLGQEVRPGDRIAYAVSEGDGVALRAGRLLEIKRPRVKSWKGDDPLRLTIQADATAGPFGPTPPTRPSTIGANFKRFVKLGEA